MTIGGSKESLLDVLCDLIQPFLSAVRLIPIVPDIRLKFLYSVFGRSKLKRNLVSHAQCTLLVFFRAARRSLKQN
jgi:hypothetical protein